VGLGAKRVLTSFNTISSFLRPKALFFILDIIIQAEPPAVKNNRCPSLQKPAVSPRDPPGKRRSRRFHAAKAEPSIGIPAGEETPRKFDKHRNWRYNRKRKKQQTALTIPDCLNGWGLLSAPTPVMKERIRYA
jgi:hypothetical protein